LDPESRLAMLLDGTELVVQSVHHQAVGRLGEGLRAVAWSEDGVIEAVESEHHPFVIGVQWHPELDALSDPPPLPLFQELVALAAGHLRRWRGYAIRASAVSRATGSKDGSGPPPARTRASVGSERSTSSGSRAIESGASSMWNTRSRLRNTTGSSRVAGSMPR